MCADATLLTSNDLKSVRVQRRDDDVSVRDVWAMGGQETGLPLSLSRACAVTELLKKVTSANSIAYVLQSCQPLLMETFQAIAQQC